MITIISLIIATQEVEIDMFQSSLSIMQVYIITVMTNTLAFCIYY